jgi:hypothetical protein
MKALGDPGKPTAVNDEPSWDEDPLGVRCPRCYAVSGQKCQKARFKKKRTKAEQGVTKNLDSPHVERIVKAHREARPDSFDPRSLYERLTGTRSSDTKITPSEAKEVTVSSTKKEKMKPVKWTPHAHVTPGSIKAIPCPFCNAKAGSPCRRPSGHNIPFGQFHRDREKAAIKKAEEKDDD